MADPLILGFDTEWDVADRSLLSVQFAVHGGVGLSTRVYDAPSRRLSADTFGRLVSAFISEVGVPVPRDHRVFIVAHYAAAEIGMFADPLRELRVRQIGKAHHASFAWRDDSGRLWRFRIVDLFAFLPTSLARVGDSIGLSKVDADATELASLKVTDRAAFDRYAARDAEIAVAAFVTFRQRLLERWGVDPLVKQTLSGVAADVFRRHFLTRNPARSRVVSVVSYRRSGT